MNACRICVRRSGSIPVMPAGAVCLACSPYLTSCGLDGAETMDGDRVWTITAWEISKH